MKPILVRGCRHDVLGRRGRRIGLFFELAFDAPVTFCVPALGHSCHFGLGLFVSVLDA